jgi:hypothetical protein
MTTALWARSGDQLVIRRHHLGEPDRDGEVLEALGKDGGPPFGSAGRRTENETLLYPGPDV